MDAVVERPLNKGELDKVEVETRAQKIFDQYFVKLGNWDRRRLFWRLERHLKGEI